MLARAAAPVLDVGCGPGRHLAALKAAGKSALGVDLSPVAVRLARRRGATAIPGDVFGDVPHGGRWRTALLLDGNIGIGGAPDALLRRVRELLAPGGAVLVEVDPPGAPTVCTRIRIEAAGEVSEWFPWARVGVDGIEPLAARAGLPHVDVRGRRRPLAGAVAQSMIGPFRPGFLRSPLRGPWLTACSARSCSCCSRSWRRPASSRTPPTSRTCAGNAIVPVARDCR